MFPDQNIRLHEPSCFSRRRGEASALPQTPHLPEAAPDVVCRAQLSSPASSVGTQPGQAWDLTRAKRPVLAGLAGRSVVRGTLPQHSMKCLVTTDAT